MTCDKCGREIYEDEFNRGFSKAWSSIMDEGFENPDLCKKCKKELNKMIGKWLK